VILALARPANRAAFGVEEAQRQRSRQQSTPQTQRRIVQIRPLPACWSFFSTNAPAEQEVCRKNRKSFRVKTSANKAKIRFM